MYKYEINEVNNYYTLITIKDVIDFINLNWKINIYDKQSLKLEIEKRCGSSVKDNNLIDDIINKCFSIIRKKKINSLFN